MEKALAVRQHGAKAGVGRLDADAQEAHAGLAEDGVIETDGDGA